MTPASCTDLSHTFFIVNVNRICFNVHILPFISSLKHEQSVGLSLLH